MKTVDAITVRGHIVTVSMTGQLAIEATSKDLEWLIDALRSDFIRGPHSSDTTVAAAAVITDDENDDANDDAAPPTEPEDVDSNLAEIDIMKNRSPLDPIRWCPSHNGFYARFEGGQKCFVVRQSSMRDVHTHFADMTAQLRRAEHYNSTGEVLVDHASSKHGTRKRRAN